MTSGPSLLSRALAEPPLTGGLLPGLTCVWWRAVGWEDERRHAEALPWLLQPAGLSDDQREAVEDLLYSLVIAVGAPSGPDADPAEALDPIPCRIHRAVLAPDQAVPYLPPAVLAGHEAMLAFAVAESLAHRAAALLRTQAATPTEPPTGCVAVPTVLGVLAVRLATYGALSGHEATRDRCLAAALAGWTGQAEGELTREADPLVVAGDVAALLAARWDGEEWRPVTAAALPHHPGDLWVGSLRWGDLVALWRAGMAPALEAAEVVRRYLPAADGDRWRPLPSATGEEPWLGEPEHDALSPAARRWASVAWAWAWRAQQARTAGL